MTEQAATWRPLVGEPQPPTCANPECRDGWVRNPSGLPLCSENGILGYSPCPSCAPTEPGDATK